VEKGGPADKAGIEAGDVILKFDGKSVVNSGDLPRLVAGTRPGTHSVAQVWRRGVSKDVPVVVGELSEERVSAARAVKGPKSLEQSANRLGLVLSELPLEQKRDLKSVYGLRIEEIKNPSARIDLRPGDVIVSVIFRGATTDVKTLEQFNKLLAQFDKGSNVTLLIRRGDIQTFVTLKVLNGD